MNPKIFKTEKGLSFSSDRQKNGIAIKKIEGLLREKWDLYQMGKSIQDVFTPIEITLDALSKIDIEKKSVLVISNSETFLFLKTMKDEYPLRYKSLNFLTDIKDLSGKDDVIYCEDLKKIGKMDFPKKFDVVISNPPYGNGTNWKLHIDFLHKAMDISAGEVLFVHPSNQYLVPGEVKNGVLDRINERIGNSLSSIDLFNGNKVFGISKMFPIAITHISVKKTTPGFISKNRIYSSEHNVSSISEVNHFNEYKHFPSIKNKISAKIKGSVEDNLYNKRSKSKGTFTGNFIVNIASRGGGVNNEGNSMWDDKFFRFFTGDKTPTPVASISEPPTYWVNFQTEQEANNFIEYLKTDFARGCLALLKTDEHINSKMHLVPWLDFSKTYSDTELFEMFDITGEEREFIRSVIS